MAKIITVAEAVAMIPNGATIIFGGFWGCGSAHRVINALAESGKRDFTIISSDAGRATGSNNISYYGVAKLIHNKQVKRIVTAHVGMTPDVSTQSMEGKTLQVDLVPQASLTEMIWAGGTGLGGVLTPTGVGTIVENSPLCLGKQTIEGQDYLLMKALKADFALVAAHFVDKAGNMWYRGTTQSFNAIAAASAKVVIAEVGHLVEIRDIVSENIVTPCTDIDYVVYGGKL